MHAIVSRLSMQSGDSSVMVKHCMHYLYGKSEILLMNTSFTTFIYDRHSFKCPKVLCRIRGYVKKSSGNLLCKTLQINGLISALLDTLVFSKVLFHNKMDLTKYINI